MALATKCPHCGTTFRVASDQLKLRGGIVRCGSCNQIFDGNAALVDLPNAALPPEPEPAPPAPLSPPAIASDPFDTAVAEPLSEEQISGPITSVDFDIFDPNLQAEPVQEIAPHAEPEPAALTEREPAAQNEPEPEPEPEPAALTERAPEPWSEPEPASPNSAFLADGELGDDDFAAPPPVGPAPALPQDIEHGPLPLLRQAAVDPEPAAPAATPVPLAKQRNKPKRKPKPEPLPELVPEPEPEPDHDEPEFVRRGRTLEQTAQRRRFAMLGGTIALALVLLAQGVTTFRNVLAAKYPSLKPVIGASCVVFRCRIELPAQIDTLSIETGELQTQGGNTFLLTTLLRNQSGLSQEWPSIELELTDANNKPLLRRVFSPADYLPASTVAARGFPARSEQPVKFTFELNQVKASDYHIAVFYP